MFSYHCSYYFAFLNKIDFATGSAPVKETKPASKARQCLTEKFEVLADEGNSSSHSATETSKKKAKLI